MTPGTIITIAALVGLVVLVWKWDALRQLLRIKGSQAVASGTTAVERNKDRYKQLKALLPAQRTNVANCMATVDDLTKDLGEAEKALDVIKDEYKTATEMGASEAALDTLGKRFEAGEQKVDRIKGRLAEARSASDEAQAALDSTIESIKAFGDKIEDSELASNLTKALETAAAAKQQAKDINDKLSEASADFDAVDHDLNVARAKNKLGDGTAADRELDEIKKKAGAKSGRSKLDALTKGASNPPAGDQPQN